MKKIAYLIYGILAMLKAEALHAQSVGLLKLHEMQERLNKGGDTTFVVNFWATWCAPCVKELPYFQEIHEKYASSGVKVLLISLDARHSLEKKVKPFVGRTGITADFFLLDESNQQEYIDKINSSWSGALPATLIVNTRRGRKNFLEGELTYPELESALQGVRD